MCSISGFLASKPLEPATVGRLCDALIYQGRYRGPQSAGICAYPTLTQPTLFKRAVDPHDFIQLPEYLELVNQPLEAALIHTRQPTCGGRGDEQAQPFLIQTDDSQCCTTHNGYYFDFDSIKAAHSITKPSGVDSELAASYIAAHGADTLPLFIEATDGPSSIAAIHNSKLYFIRHGNPLTYAFITLSDSTNVLVWASTAEILRAALSYTWLFTTLPTTASTDQGFLYTATPTKLTKVSTEPVKPKARQSRTYTPPTDTPHPCIYQGGALSTYFTTACRCIREGTHPNFTYRENPNWPASTTPKPPTPTPTVVTDSDAEDELDTPFYDPALDPYLGFWLSDAILDLPSIEGLKMARLLTRAIHAPLTMVASDWEALGKLLLQCIEVSNAD